MAECNWNKVNDRLPVERSNDHTLDFDSVLCATTFGDVREYKFGTALGHEKPHFWHGCEIMDQFVTHWMYFPPMPQEERKENDMKFEREVYAIVQENPQGDKILMNSSRWSGLCKLGKDGDVKTYETLQKARQGLSYLQNCNRRLSEGARIAKIKETIEVVGFEEHVADPKERQKRAMHPLYYAGRIPVEVKGIPAQTFCRIKTTPREDFQTFAVEVYYGERLESSKSFEMGREEFKGFKESVLDKL